MSQTELARQLTDSIGKSIDRAAINKMLKGTRAISAAELLAIEQILGTSYPRTLQIPLKGMVGAGAEVNLLSNDDLWEMVDAPPNPKLGCIAVRVSGDSMFPAYEDGELIYYSENLPPDMLLNRKCVVKLADGRIFVKILQPGRDGFFNLASINPLYPQMVDQAVEWAARIDWTRPR